MTQQNEELTLENFAALLMWQITHGGYHTLFLATSEEHKAERLDLLYQNFEKWKAHELAMKKAREARG